MFNPKHFRMWLQQPVAEGYDEITWGACALAFLGCMGIILLCFTW